MMTLILWEANYSAMPADKGSLGKLLMNMLESTKKTVDSGQLKAWGVSAGGGRGFAIMEGDAKEVYASALMYHPYVDMEVTPMLSVEEAIDVMKGMQQ